MEQDADISSQDPALSPEVLRQMGLRIADRRQARGWTQRGLGRRVGISSSRLSRLERGHCTARLGELAKLRNVLGIDLDEMVFGRRSDSTDSRLERLARRLSEVGTRAEFEIVERLLECLLSKEPLS